MEVNWYKKVISKNAYEMKLAELGVGYHRLDEFPDGVYAFRRPNVEAATYGLIACTDEEVSQLEKVRRKYQGLRDLRPA